MTEAIQTVVSLLRMRAEQQADSVAYTFVSAAGRSAEITYAELDKRAGAVGSVLSNLHVYGKPVLLLYPPGIEYISAFFGCLYAGGIAVPATLPARLRPGRSLSRLDAIAGDAGPCVALTTAAARTALSLLSGSAPKVSGLEMMAIGDVADGRQETWEPTLADAESIALLHYASGTGSAPKGVVLTHRNLISNCELICCLFGRSQESRSMTWLPPDHGMGLIGGIIQPLYGGFPATLMAPAEFLQRPLRWLQEISRTRATVSGGPSFAYDLCVRQTTVEERLRLDLSNWQVAINTSASVHAETMERFAHAFKPAGFRHEAFHPCYGLAEVTSIVTGGIAWPRRGTRAFDAAALSDGEAIPGTADGTSRRLVSCGYAPVDHCRVVIVDPVTRMECPAGQVGEIWVSGSSVARSYWHRPEETRRVFGARLAGTGDGPFARSGDLGFMLDHELFVTRRTKDAANANGGGHDRNALDEAAHVRAAPWRSGNRISSWHRSPWFVREIEPGAPGHRTAVALLFRGELDVSALEDAAGLLVVRRAASFQCRDEEPGRRYIGSTSARLEETRGLDEAQLPAWLESAAHEPFDRARGPLLRLNLYRRAADETVVLVVAHRVIADFWSITALVRELEASYAERKGGISEPLTELTDFVRQYCWIGGSRVSAHASPAADSVASPGGLCLGRRLSSAS